jgi:hypothetical protein
MVPFFGCDDEYVVHSMSMHDFSRSFESTYNRKGAWNALNREFSLKCKNSRRPLTKRRSSYVVQVIALVGSWQLAGHLPNCTIRLVASRPPTLQVAHSRLIEKSRHSSYGEALRRIGVCEDVATMMASSKPSASMLRPRGPPLRLGISLAHTRGEAFPKDT